MGKLLQVIFVGLGMFFSHQACGIGAAAILPQNLLGRELVQLLCRHRQSPVLLLQTTGVLYPGIEIRISDVLAQLVLLNQVKGDDTFRMYRLL